MRYEIKGETLPVVICYLDAGEKIITENGGMSWMSPNMEMKTSSNGGIGKMFGRMFSGEKMFQNVYTAKGEEGMIAFASCFPGSIRAFDVSKGDMVLQKKAFLASEAGVELSVFFNKRVGSACLAGKDLSCRDCQAKVLLLLNLMDMWLSMTWKPANSWLWIQDILRP